MAEPPLALHPGAPARSQAWLYGPARDLLLGYGLAYVLSVPVLLALSPRWSGSPGALWVAALLAILLSTPHYGATLLRVYENRDERRTYVFFAVWVTLALAGAFVLALYSARVGSLLLTTYIVWGIWHFSAQNYGLSVMYLRRRGAELGPDVKRPLYASFVSSTLLALLAMHVVDAPVAFAAWSQDPSGTFHFLRLGIPQPMGALATAAATLAYLGAIALVVSRLRRRLPVRQLGPVGLLLVTQSLWYSVPALGMFLGAWGSLHGGYRFAAIWISLAHAVQYLWVTSYYAQRSGRCTGLPAHWTKCLLAGAAVSLPALIFAPGLLGSATANSAGIVVLVFSVMNLHHFALDGAIWRLRDGRVARVLLRTTTPPPAAPGGWRWARAAVFALGAVVLAQQLYGAWLVRIVGREDTALALRRAAARDLRSWGLDSAGVWLTLAHRAEKQGQRELAIAAYRSGLQMESRPSPWATSRLTWLLLRERGDDPRSLHEATRLAEYLARALGDTRPEGYQTLAAAHAAGGRWAKAMEAAELAFGIAHAKRDAARAAELARALSTYRAELAALGPDPPMPPRTLPRGGPGLAERESGAAAP